VKRTRLHDRRTILTGIAAVSAMHAFGMRDAFAAQDDGAFLDRLYSNATGIPRSESSGLATASYSCRPPTREQLDWYVLPEGKRPAVSWPTDAQSVDYAHLQSFTAGDQEFELSSAILEFICVRNSFEIAADKIVAFGLRGCKLSSNGDDSGWGASHRLKTVRPNHRNRNCLIGVWDRDRDSTRLFAGSTVPEATYMYAFANSFCADPQYRVGCNMMLTGLYKFEVGQHPRGARPRGHTHYQPGALLEAGPVAYIRTTVKLEYNPTLPNSILEFDTVGNNIHAGGSPPSPCAVGSGCEQIAEFSSAGCQVVSGDYSNNIEPEGSWREFRLALGLSNPPDPRENKRQFHYFLVTGDDAYIASQQSQTVLNEYWRYRPGSSGHRVLLLQKRLLSLKQVARTFVPDAAFGRQTFLGVINLQQCRNILPGSAVDDQLTSQMCSA
jgi:hypothetical protein